jgi:hypothetical protein
MTINVLNNAELFIQQYIEKGGDAEQANTVLSNLLELAVVMYQKGDIKTIQQPQKIELVCQLKKGSRRHTLVD